MYSKIISYFISQYNYLAFSPKAILFDMDGVLFDSMKGHAYAWVKAMNEVGLPFAEKDAYLNEGQTGANTINNAFISQHGREATEKEKKDIYQLKSHYFDEYGKPEPMEGALELLKKVKQAGLKIVVVTGSGQPSLINNLERYFPGIFDADKVITAFDVKYGKPHPEPYLLGLNKAGVEPWEAIAVDNAPLGVKSSSSARIFTVGLNTGPLAEEVLIENGANVVLGSMEEFDKELGLLLNNNM